MPVRSLRWLPALFLAGCLAAPPAFAEVLDRIIAVVNDGVVLQSDLDREMEQARHELKARGIEEPDQDTLRNQVLERLILTRVQTERAQQAGIRIDDRELNDVLANIAQNNNMTLAQFADAIKGEGGDFLAVREQVRDEVAVTRLRQKEVDGRVSVTEQDIDLFLAQQGSEDETEFHLTHILVAIPDGATPEQREQAHAKADGLLKRLKAGEDFASIAVANSDGQQALQGGDLDWRKADSLPTLFAATARTLKDGETSAVLESSSGFHIIRRVAERNGGERKSVTETHSRHILVPVNALLNDDQARLQARDIYDQLMKGADFAKLASTYSEDPGSKNAGGDLGWQPPGVFAPDFQIRIDQLKPGETTQPFRTQFGWHVAQVLDRRTRDVTEESRRARARGAVQQRKSAEEYDIWLRRLRDEAYVEFRNGMKPPDTKTS